MVKVMIFLSRQPQLTSEAFDQHLREMHVPLVVQLPGLRRLVINRVLPDPSGASPAWNAVAEDWFDSPEAMQTAMGSPQGQAVNADGATFLDLSKIQFLMVQEEDVPLRTSE